MQHNALTFRWLIAACLAMGVGSTGLGSPLAPVADGAAQRPAAAWSLATCCCGGADERCCGKVCCVPRSPRAPETPVPTSQSSEHPPTYLGLAFSHAGGLRLGRNFVPYAQYLHDSRCGSPEFSLQSLQVRLDI